MIGPEAVQGWNLTNEKPMMYQDIAILCGGYCPRMVVGRFEKVKRGARFKAKNAQGEYEDAQAEWKTAACWWLL